ncbi:MAG: hypothetical protein ACE5EK_04470 [Nitrospinales bacterium]
MSKNTGNIKLNFRFHIALKLFTVIGTLLFVAPSYASDLCQDGKKQLRGNYEVMQSDGGLWALMERSESLKDQSTLGFQIDNKCEWWWVLRPYAEMALKKNRIPVSMHKLKKDSIEENPLLEPILKKYPPNNF